MANALYGLGKQKLLSSTNAVSLDSDTIKVGLVTTSYTPSLTTDEFVSVLGATMIGTPQTLGTKTVTLGVFDAADAVFTAVASGSTLKGVVIYKDTGNTATSPLIAFIDTLTGFPLTTNGGDITIQWDNGAYKIFSL